jgi:CheY-like chemotaxis protein
LTPKPNNYTDLDLTNSVDTIIINHKNHGSASSLNKEVSPQVKTNSARSKKILVVEDDLITQEVLGLFLQDVFELEYVAKAEEAIEMIRNNDYLAVLMDINLGRGKNGLHVTREVRAMKGKERLPIVAQTAFAMKGDREEFLDAGCDYYLSKPFTKDELRSILFEITSR